MPELSAPVPILRSSIRSHQGCDSASEDSSSGESLDHFPRPEMLRSRRSMMQPLRSRRPWYWTAVVCLIGFVPFLWLTHEPGRYREHFRHTRLFVRLTRERRVRRACSVEECRKLVKELSLRVGSAMFARRWEAAGLCRSHRECEEIVRLSSALA